MAKARPRFKDLEDLTRTQAEALIREANLGDENTVIAVDYFILSNENELAGETLPALRCVKIVT